MKASRYIIISLVIIFTLIVNSLFLIKQEKDLNYYKEKNYELGYELRKNEENYTNTIKEIIKTVQITDSYLFVGGFNQEESAAFNIKKYEEMLTMKSNLDDLLQDTQNFFQERTEYLAEVPNIWPLLKSERIRITSPFGDRYSPFTGKIYQHDGIDLMSVVGDKIIATADGTVSQLWLHNHIFGRYVVITHTNGIKTHYGHLSRIFVKYKQQVKKGDVIGIIGNSGLSTGTHLHYAISVNGIYVDPVKYLKLNKLNEYVKKEEASKASSL
jgi:murein DD-endopeptidase MepM/ murein hydrolase activator NlpD